MFLLIYFIRSAKSKGEQIISNQRLKKNPYDVKSLTKSGFENINKNSELAISQLEKARRLDPNNYDAAIVLCITYHYEGQYDKSKKILIELFEEKEINWPDEVLEVSGDQITLAEYFYGHIKYLDGDQELAEKSKEKVNKYCEMFPELKKIIDGLNLY